MKTIQKLGHIHSRKIFSFLKITLGFSQTNNTTYLVLLHILYVSHVFHSYLWEIVRKEAAVTSKNGGFSKGFIFVAKNKHFKWVVQ